VIKLILIILFDYGSIYIHNQYYLFLFYRNIEQQAIQCGSKSHSTVITEDSLYITINHTTCEVILYY